MQPRPVAGGVCGKGIGLEKVGRLLMIEIEFVMGLVMGGGYAVTPHSIPHAANCVFIRFFLPGFTLVTILGVGSSVGKKKKGLQTKICNPLICLAPQHGLEPRTQWLTATCSAN